MTTGIRLFALVDKMSRGPQVKHFLGMPPDLTAGRDRRERLPWPRVLVIEERPHGIFLFRFAEDGSFGGDTWHMSVIEAEEQAKYEYGDALSEWRRVPAEVSDAVAFAFTQIP
jgi:hypothetical protein